MSTIIQSFGRIPSGEQVQIYTMTNQAGASVAVTNYGGILVSIKVPDRSGALGDVLLGYDEVGGYCPNEGYIGALIGRVGNRIARGEGLLNGKLLSLNTNSNGQHLHGGYVGFDKKLWTVTPDMSENKLALHYVSPDGEENYPGTLSVKVTYSWSDDNALGIHYEAACDRDTLINLTNHAYFNLSGEGVEPIDHQTISIAADFFTAVDRFLIPTGELRPVAGTPFDLRAPRLIGEAIAAGSGDEQMRFGGGFDHNFCANGTGMREVAVVTSPQAGRRMTVSTDQPGVQFYTANALHGIHIAKCGRKYAPRDGLCLETQNYPDAVNHAEFPESVLRAGARYDTCTIYRFGVI